MKTSRLLVLALAALCALLAPALHAQDALLQPTAITSSTAPDFFPVGNLIDGSGLSGTPTLAALGTHSTNDANTLWVTASNAPDYFLSNGGRPPVVLRCTLPQLSLVSELVYWGYGGNHNEAKTFDVSFSLDGITFTTPVTVTNPTLVGTGAARLVFPGGPRQATHVRLTITDNHFGTGGNTIADRVGLGEIRFAGQLSGQVIVRNLDNAVLGDDILDTTSATPDKVAAHAFTTGPAPLVPGSITLRLRRASTNNPTVRVKLWSGAGNVPVTELLDLGTLSIPNASYTNFTWNAAPGTAPTLAPGTRYWVTAENEAFPTVCHWGVTADGTFTGSGTLPTARAVSTDSGANWADATNGNIHLLQVTGVSPFVVTNPNDSGPGSLRQAMADADAFPGADTITFAPALSGQTITLTSDEIAATAIDITSEVTVDASALAGGVSISGGNARRIFYLDPDSKLTLRGLTLKEGNAGSAASGAIFNNFGTLALTHCTLSGNFADRGGAISSSTDSITGPINSSTTLTHCTLSGNTAIDRGGAIYNANGRTTLLHCTVSGNTALAGAGSGVASFGDTVTETVVQNSIIAGNVNSDVDFFFGATNSFKSEGYNLIGSGNAIGDFFAAGDLINTAPQLAPLGSYGGPTQTRPPLAGSPAIDSAIVLAPPLPTDQRGAPRLSGSAPDIGAVELGQILVNTTSDENNGLTTGGISLREAIAHNVPFEAELIRFDPAVFTGALPTTNTILLTINSGGSAISVTRALVGVDASTLPAGVTLDGGAQTFRLINMQSGSNLALRGLTLANGRAPGDGGGAIANSFGMLTLTRCTLSDNSAVLGGAIYSETASVTGAITSSTTLAHCTLSGNTATVRGGAIHNDSGRTTLLHCTVSGNTALAGAGSGVASFGGTDTETVVQNSIIAGNGNSDVEFIFGATNSFKSEGYNLIGGGNATTSPNNDFDQTGDLINVAPQLAALGNYGGATQTRPPLANSPAIDAAVAVAGLPTDQRGLPRASGPAPDIGAVELQEIRVNTLADENNGIGNGSSVSLREALTSTAPGVAEVVRFAPAVFNGTPVGKNTIPLGSEIVVTKSVLVDAGDIPAGVTLDGGAQNFRLIWMLDGSNLALRGLTLTNGRAPSDVGGAIYNSFGTLTLTRCTLSGNSANFGGAILSNTASITGSITSSTTLSHCTLSGNTATGVGGAIYNANGRTTLLHCTVSGNTAPAAQGSGVASGGITAVETVVQNSIIAGNVNSDVDFFFGATNSFKSEGYNLIGTGNATTTPNDFNQTGDLINVAPLLAPLGDYGGPTRTMLPLPGSPAIDAATTSTAPTDQRGILRPQGPARDIGAVETFTLTGFQDTDSDGMDDRLEPLYGFTVGVPDGALDADGDGSSNAAELGNQTSPRDSTSLLRILAFTFANFNLNGDPRFDVTWTSFPGLTYTIEAKADLNFAVAPRESDPVTATGFTHTLRIELDKNNPEDFIRARRN